MRVMILAKSSPQTEQAPPSGVPGDFEAMGRFTRELKEAGMLLASDRLEPSSQGRRIRYERKRQTVIDGPFTESKELVGGYWIWQVQSLDEAIDWLKRAPMPEGQELEVRPIFEPDDATAAVLKP